MKTKAMVLLMASAAFALAACSDSVTAGRIETLGVDSAESGADSEKPDGGVGAFANPLFPSDGFGPTVALFEGDGEDEGDAKASDETGGGTIVAGGASSAGVPWGFWDTDTAGDEDDAGIRDVTIGECTFHDAVYGEPYQLAGGREHKCVARGGDGESYTWRVGGDIPDGLRERSDTNEFWLEGAVNQFETSTFTVTVSSAGVTSAPKTVTIRVADNVSLSLFSVAADGSEVPIGMAVEPDGGFNVRDTVTVVSPGALKLTVSSGHASDYSWRLVSSSGGEAPIVTAADRGRTLTLTPASASHAAPVEFRGVTLVVVDGYGNEAEAVIDRVIFEPDPCDREVSVYKVGEIEWQEDGLRTYTLAVSGAEAGIVWQIGRESGVGVDGSETLGGGHADCVIEGANNAQHVAVSCEPFDEMIHLGGVSKDDVIEENISFTFADGCGDRHRKTGSVGFSLYPQYGDTGLGDFKGYALMRLAASDYQPSSTLTFKLAEGRSSSDIAVQFKAPITNWISKEIERDDGEFDDDGTINNVKHMYIKVEQNCSSECEEFLDFHVSKIVVYSDFWFAMYDLPRLGVGRRYPFDNDDITKESDVNPYVNGSGSHPYIEFGVTDYLVGAEYGENADCGSAATDPCSISPQRSMWHRMPTPGNPDAFLRYLEGHARTSALSDDYIDKESD